LSRLGAGAARTRRSEGTRCALAALALVTTVGATGLEAQDTQWNRYTLEGLGGVFVRTEANAACEGVGMAASDVQADAAVLLLEAEVPLLTREQMLANVGLPELRITLECAVGDGTAAAGAFAYSVSVRVQQAAQMIRDSQVTLAEAVTWYATAVGVSDAAAAGAVLEEALRAKLTEFSSAYGAANTADPGSG